MKYTIYKTNHSFNFYRWWKNYDANNKNLPDIDIESFVTNVAGLRWEQLLNTRNQPIKYETLNKDTIDEIELYFDDINNIPDYLKIVFTKADNTTENAYFYIDRQPSIYNATEKLSVKVRYVLDKYASFMYTFHNYLITNNPQMFYVRKHCNRFKKNTDNVWYFDTNLDTWLNINTEEYRLIVKNKQVIDSDTAIDRAIEHLNTLDEHITFKYATHTESGETYKCVQWRHDSMEEGYWYHTIGTWLNRNDEDVTKNQIEYCAITDDIFNAKGMYEYVITKPQGFSWSDDDKILATTSFWLWPVKNTNLINGQVGTFGSENSIYSMMLHATLPFTADNIIGRYITPLSPVTYMLLQTKSLSLNLDENRLTLNGIEGYTDDTESVFKYGLVETNGDSVNLEIKNNYFINSITNCLTDINNGIYSKDIAHNPHIYSPTNFRLVYRASTNNESVLTTDYINLENYDTTKLYYSSIVTPEWASRLLVNNWNDNKALSQTANEITTTEVRQAPISSSAYNNTYLQRQVLDTGRNNQIKSSATTIGASATSLLIGTLLTLTGFGAGLGVMGVIGGIAGVTKGGINLSNGLAQNEAQKRALMLQADTLNNTTNTNGLTPFDTWAKDGIIIYTEGLSEMDAVKINNDDNMYGYYQNKWLPYSDYLACWDGNYMLCDISKNYNTLFNLLKRINSIYTINDNYVNEFLNALNNGITWFDNGIYKDLATDTYNWERVFPRHTKKARVKRIKNKK